MNRIPKQTEINTKRLFLRSIVLKDAEALFNYRSDSLANQYQGWIPKTLNDSIEFITNSISQTIDQANTWFQFGIINKENNLLIGDIGIHFIETHKFQVEIGFTLDKKYQGKGYAYEALTAVINFLFFELNKRRVIASIDPQNDKSINLLTKLGFRKEAHFKESIYLNGAWYDDMIFALLKQDWNGKNKSDD